MAFDVEITQRAKQDLDSILHWLASEGAGDAGLRWFHGLHDSVASLANSPRRCSLAPENTAFSAEVRQLIYGKPSYAFRILFTIDCEVVRVLRVRRGRRLPVGAN